MDTYSKAFEETIASLPKALLVDLLKKKLDVQGVQLSEKKLQFFSERILKGESISIESFFDRVRRKIGLVVRETVVDFTEEDLKAIQEAFENYIEGLPQTLEDISEELSGDFLASLMKSWPREARREKTERDAFRKRLYTRWGAGIDHLRLLITIAREVGSEIHMDGKKAADAPLSMNVLTRLHARGCQIAEEIVCLLEGGFADGAMARWRTLHEISAVSALIEEHGEELAERYIEHDGIESARAARQYQKYHSRLGLEAIAVDEIKEIEERAKALKEKYGKEFGSSNGWAAKHVGILEPKIDQLIAAAGMDHLAPYYKLASHNVHANPKGIFFKLGIINEMEGLLAGPSNAGLADPAHSTAISLTQITASIALSNPTLDDLIAMKAIHKLVDVIGGVLGKVDRQLELDEAQINGVSEL